MNCSSILSPWCQVGWCTLPHSGWLPPQVLTAPLCPSERGITCSHTIFLAVHPSVASIFWATHSPTLIPQQAHSHWDRIRDLSPTLRDPLGYFFVCVGMCVCMGVWAYAFGMPAMWRPIWILYHQNEGILTKWGWSPLSCTPSNGVPWGFRANNPSEQPRKIRFKGWG